MATNEIQVGRYNGILHKLLAMKEGAPSPLLAPEIFPTLQLEGERPEWAFLGGERLCIGHTVKAAVGANYSYLWLSNPGGSNTLVVVEGIINNTASNTHYLSSAPDAAGSSRGAQLDARSGLFPTAIASAAELGIGNAVARPGTQLCFIWMILGQPITFFPVILSPGSSLYVSGNVVNRDVNITFFWRERAFEPSESR